MEEIKKLQPRAFTKFCMSIGEVPSSYIASLSYEEQLLWFCSYLEKTVIPAVNDNGKAVGELQALYTQLKDYVDHYFDNLDVQEEINNKLDDMAEQGQLTDIIAQYLQLAGVLAYDTKTSMKAATNLVDGSITKTLGDSSLNDGKGSFYKVREVLNTDDIDDENIIALNDPNLVAEKIVDNFVKITTNMPSEEIKRIVELDYPKYVIFETGEYTLTDALHLPNGTILDFNGSTIISDFTALYDETIGFYGYKFTDEFTGFTGNEIVMKNGTISGGSIALMHNINSRIENINFVDMLHAFHNIQIAGCKNTTISNCTFNGVTIPSPETEENYIFKEVINIDPCIYGAQPYMDENSPMYDGTVNEGIYIVDNVFNNGDGTHNKCYVCIGSHAAVENYETISKHIVIKNNKFNYAYYSCLQFTSLEDVEIDNNYFNGYNARNTVTFLMTRVTNNDFKLTNNKVENVCEFLHTGSFNASYYNENFIISDNKIQNETVTINNESTFLLGNFKNVLIANNDINSNGIALYLYDICENIEFLNNNVISNDNIPIKMYGTSVSKNNKIIGNNIFSNNAVNNYAVNIDGQIDYIVANNSYNNEQAFCPSIKVTKGVYNNTALFPITDVFDAQSFSDVTAGAPLENLKALKVLCGSGQHAQVITLNPFIHNGQYLDSRTMQAPMVNEDNSIGLLSVTIDTTTNKISATSTGKMRRIYGVS